MERHVNPSLPLALAGSGNLTSPMLLAIAVCTLRSMTLRKMEFEALTSLPLFLSFSLSLSLSLWFFHLFHVIRSTVKTV